MRTLKILHVASFTGNIGDNASHIGLYHVLDEVLRVEPTIEKLEIRKFYKKYNLGDKQSFDSSFVTLANKFDLVILGGGGFLDFCIDGSCTGTTFDISTEDLSKIKTPLLITSVGSIPQKYVPEENYKKFEAFLAHLIENDNIALALRNDGSKEVIRDLFGSKFADQIPEILDNGFFFSPMLSSNWNLDRGYLALNIAVDQLAMKNRIIGEIDYQVYQTEMRKFIQRVIDETELYIVLIPHIFSDLRAFHEVLSGINDFHIRTRILIAPYMQGDFGSNYNFSIYQNAKMDIGMRLHANICSMAMENKTLGLAALDRLYYLYASLSSLDDLIMINGAFSENLYSKLSERISTSKANDQLMITLKEKKTQSLATYRKMLRNVGLSDWISEHHDEA